jgi:Domain of unknown function (DUF4381)
MRAPLVLFLAIVSLPPCGGGSGWGDDPVRVQDQGKASLWLERSAADPLSVKLSEKLTIFMRVEGEQPLEIELTEKVRSTAGWHLEMLGKPTSTPLDNDKGVRWQQVFVATPLEPGPQPLQLPALQFTEKGGEEQKIAWQPLELRITTRVAKVDVSEARDRSGIEELPPVPAPQPWWLWLLLAVPLMAIAALLIWRRRRGRPVIEPPPGPAALRELEELGRIPASNADDVKRFYMGLSDVLRRYLEKRFQLPATRLTTAEFSAALAKAWPQNGVHQKVLDDILQRCDLAKFAEIIPAPDDSQAVITAVRGFVEATATQTNHRDTEAQRSELEPRKA